MDDDKQEQEEDLEDLDTAMEGADRSSSLSVEDISDQQKQVKVRELLRSRNRAWMWTEEELTSERDGIQNCAGGGGHNRTQKQKLLRIHLPFG